MKARGTQSRRLGTGKVVKWALLLRNCVADHTGEIYPYEQIERSISCIHRDDSY